MSKRCKY